MHTCISQFECYALHGRMGESGCSGEVSFSMGCVLQQLGSTLEPMVSYAFHKFLCNYFHCQKRENTIFNKLCHNINVLA